MDAATDLRTLWATTQAAIDEGRIGQPVFLRGFAQVSPGEAALREAAAAALWLAAGWMGGPPTRVMALGGPERAQITIAVEFGGGQSGLLGISGSAGEPSRLEWVLVGNRGTMRFEGPMPRGAPPPDTPLVLEAVWRSLSTKEPVEVAGEGAA